MADKQEILLLSSTSSLLGSAIFELLSRQEHFHVDSIEDFSHKSVTDRIEKNYSLILYLAPYSFSALLPKLNAMRKAKTKLLLVLGVSNKNSISYLGENRADGAVSVESSFQELMAAIHTLIFKKLKYLSPLLLSSLYETSGKHPFSSLSSKELEVAMMLTNGKRNIEIASELKISQKTVNTYKSRIYKKLDISSDMQFLRLSMQNEMPGNFE